MAIKFSNVKLISEEKSVEFLIGGVPTEQADLNGWKIAEEFLKRLDKNSNVQLNAQVYVYGDGEKVNADPVEVAYIMQQKEKRPDFLQERCKLVGSVNFVFNLTEDSEISDVKKLYTKGTRIMLVQMYDDTHPIPMGTKGTVDYVDDASNIHMKWDNGRTLALCPKIDQFIKIDGVKLKEEDKIVELDNEVYAVMPGQAIDCSRLGCFDDLEEDSWNLIKQYCAALGVKILPDMDGEIPISYTMAKEVQDTILDKLKDIGVKMAFDYDEINEQGELDEKTEEIKMGVM